MKRSIQYIAFISLMISCRGIDTSSSMMRQDPVQINEEDSTVIVQAGKIYEAGKTKRTFLGDHYRDVWTAPVEVPVINLKTIKGGMKILERGGGMQTYSLKLEAADGKLYSLRSIQKDPSPALPEALRSTVADKIFQDQISASHPYGAFILPLLGDAAGIYHTNPELYYLPDTEYLGEFREEFGGMLVMLEEDADEDWSDYEDFGFTENAVSTNSVLEALSEDNDNQVDDTMLLRSRLFDIWIGDWDRHEGQWRWAEIEEEDEKGILYRPIPEDRDNVFFKFDGALPWVASRKWAVRKFQSFDEDIRDIAGLNFNARNFDRRFLTGMERKDWIAIADTLQRRLTDDVIDEAISLWPDTIQDLTGKEISNLLKVRRDKLKKFANEYYEILANEVNVHGSDKHEYFEVERIDEENTKVTVYKSNDEQEKEEVLYQRNFLTDETSEIRLYGFENADYFHVSGSVKESPLIRIIGGDGEDYITDSSHVRGLADKTKVYDIKEETKLALGSEARDFTSRSLDVNRYDFNGFNYNLLAPQLFVGYNVDDGIFVGGGVLLETNNFRKYEYSTRQRLVANVALKTGAYNFIYEGDFREALQSIDFNVNLEVRAPDYTSNFFGYGNSSPRLASRDELYYRFRGNEILFTPGFKIRFGDNNSFKFGPAYEYFNVQEDVNSFISSVEANISSDAFQKVHMAGALFEGELNSIKNDYYPLRGIRWNSQVAWYHGILGQDQRYGRIQTDLNIFLTPGNWPITLAARIGGASNVGEFYFFQSNTLGGNAGFNRQGNIRGYVRDRFAGRSTIYQNTELRLKLADVNIYIIPMQVGLLAFLDQGRVWSDVPESSAWHRGYGGGVFIQPIDRWVLTAIYAISEEDKMINVNLGFLF